MKTNSNVSYQPLRITLAKKDLLISNVCLDLGLSTRTRAKLGKDEIVSLSTVVKLCVYLDVPIESVVEVILPSRESESSERV